MNKRYEDYAVQRRQKLDVDGRIALSVFSTAHEIGSTLLDLRQQCGMTQRDLSEISGVTQADISRFERGVITPAVPTLMRLVKALGASVAIVVDGKAPRSARGSRPVRSRS